MKVFLCVLAIFLYSFAAFGQNKTEKSADKSTDKQTLELPKIKREKPQIEMQKAFKIMKKFVKKQKIDTSNYYLSRVNMIQYGAKDNRKPAWYFRWVNVSESLGDYIEIAVFMDGSVARLPSM